MKIKRLEPECNLATVRDGRGGIFTYYPKDPIVEFNFMFIKEHKIRGNHWHPEFDEYFLLTSGEGIMVTKDEDEKEKFLYLSKGQCVHSPKNTKHVFYAITDCEAVVMLTKKWDDCNPPIIHENLGMGTGDHGDPNYKGSK
ncbi:cupin domain-containing protein [Candidatus Woesearchaeota archaeon]|nr:cupin domain-containing protein [Candidatus Woesearchaeota archaeon]